MRLLCAIAMLAVSGCLCCPQVRCAFGLDVSVSDANGSVSDFSVTVTEPGFPAKAIACPGDSACSGGVAHFVVHDSAAVTISATAGSLSAAEFSTTPSYSTPTDALGCRGCPQAQLDVTVR